MGEAIENITNNYVRLKDRIALERMREHRNKLLQDYRVYAEQGFRVKSLETSLQEDVNAIDDAFAPFNLACAHSSRRKVRLH